MNQSLSYEYLPIMTETALAPGFPSLFTAQAPGTDFTAAGDQPSDYSNVAGLVNVPCTAPPNSTARLQATEVKALAEIMASELHHVLLNKWYPTLDAGWRNGWRCVIDGTAYDIIGVESDSHELMTRVGVKLGTI